ncbi:hypothetical protein DFH07DRAFT_763959 [Mycena maculata]|uniref:Uncharacterized protein n=1 Tax=Mycena maculata TaxID=230809 RepID=A0AAD7P2X5_9AGAR|nr:hypothetical protein DFH07DRAFT_763959 [Mycena maculata]
MACVHLRPSPLCRTRLQADSLLYLCTTPAHCGSFQVAPCAAVAALALPKLMDISPTAWSRFGSWECGCFERPTLNKWHGPHGTGEHISFLLSPLLSPLYEPCIQFVA